MAEQKTQPTKVDVKRFIADVPNETRRKDAEALLKMFAKTTGWKPQMWGPTIVGFGRYEYTYDSGHSGESCVCGFSPRKTSLVIYPGQIASSKRAALLKKLGKHKSGAGCVYINKLSDIDPEVLVELIDQGVRGMQKAWKVTAS